MISAEQIFSFIAGALIAAAQVQLIADIMRSRIKVSVLSWAGWCLLMGTGLLSQVAELGWEWNLLGLALSTGGCMAVAITALVTRNYLIKRSDWIYLVLGLLCLFIYESSKDPWITTCFAIVADFVVGIPTLMAAYRHPATQRTPAWILGGVSWTITLFLCVGHAWLYALFPIYLFLYNWAMVVLTKRKDRVRD